MVGYKHAAAVKRARTQTRVTGEEGQEQEWVAVGRWQRKRGGEEREKEKEKEGRIRRGGGREGQRWVSEAHLQFKTRFGIMKM